MEKSALRLPRLKTRDELLRTAPELGRFLVPPDADGTLVAPSRAQSPLKAPPRSPGAKRPGSPRRLRKFSDDETTEEDRVVCLHIAQWYCFAAVAEHADVHACWAAHQSA